MRVVMLMVVTIPVPQLLRGRLEARHLRRRRAQPETVLAGGADARVETGALGGDGAGGAGTWFEHFLALGPAEVVGVEGAGAEGHAFGGEVVAALVVEDEGVAHFVVWGRGMVGGEWDSRYCRRPSKSAR